jgi:hypothetical protein
VLLHRLVRAVGISDENQTLPADEFIELGQNGAVEP